MKRLALLVIAAFLIALSGCQSDKGRKEVYELQEKCRDLAAREFKEHYENDYNIQSYTTHYNLELNRCFFLLKTSVPSKEAKETQHRIIRRAIVLVDLNESRYYGTYLEVGGEARPSKCQVLNKECDSETDWNSLIEPYMEN
jgi:hypothetical protein